MQKTFRASFVGALLLMTIAPPTVAQTAQDRGPVLVALLDAPLANSTRALVIRYGDRSQPDLIVASSDGQPENSIGGALAALWRARKKSLGADETEVIHVTAAVPADHRPPALHAMLRRTLENVRRGDLREIGSLGKGRVILLPSATVGGSR